MDRLTRLANKWRTDKGTEEGVANGYTSFYEPTFSKYECPTIVEIGILNGGSIHMLNDYYDGNCKIIACDINDNTKKYVSDLQTVTFVHVDASNVDSLRNLKRIIDEAGGADILIDDASHIWSDISKTLIELHGSVKENGVYIIEDLHLGMPLKWTDQYSEGRYINDAPALYLLLPQSNDIINGADNDELRNSIDTVTLYSRKNDKQDETKCGDGRCITSIITFIKKK